MTAPREPTKEMLAQGRVNFFGNRYEDNRLMHETSLRSLWRAMYDAAPPAAPPEPAADAWMAEQDARMAELDETIKDAAEKHLGQRPMRISPPERRAYRYGLAAADALIEQQARELAEWKRAYESVQAACMKANEDCGRAEAALAAHRKGKS